MDTLFYNGIISTLDSQDTIAEAIGITDGKISFVGSNQEAAALSSKERIDLAGKMVLPGFVDSHLHMLHYAFVENSVKLFDCRSVQDVLDAAAERLAVRKEKPLSWLFGRGWNEELFDEAKYPDKKQLDALADDIPILLVRVCGHTAVCNSCGLEKLKQIKQYPEICRDVDEEHGILKENAVQFFYSVLDAPTQEEVEDLIQFGISKLNEAGVTAIQSDDLASLPGKNWRRIMSAFKALDNRGEMNLRIYEQCLFERFEDLKGFLKEGYRTGQRGDFFTIGPVKLLQDGSLGARTAALSQPYEGDSSNTGLIIYEQEELNEIVACCDKHQMQIAVHCIGDRAMDMVIKAIEASPYRKDNPKDRHGIVHAQITNQKVLDDMKKNHIIAYIQPVFLDLDMDIVESRIGSQRMDKVYAWKSMLDMGIPVSGGSDAPVVSFDVLENIYFAVTRKNIHGQPEEGWIPEEAMSVHEAVRLFTKDAAYSSYSEKVSGTIEVGKYADLVVLNQNIYDIPPEKIKDAQVEMTVLNGKVIYQK